MAVVSTRAGRLGDRIAVAAVILVTLVFLSPIYWIGSTAFKPLVLATSVPPTVVFEPEITPFVKLFTKRAQLTDPRRARGLRGSAMVGEADLRRRRTSLARRPGGGPAVGLSQPLPQLADHRHHLDGACGLHGHDHRLWLLALQGQGRGGPALLHPVDAHAAADRRRDPDVPDVPGPRPQRHAYRPDHCSTPRSTSASRSG